MKNRKVWIKIWWAFLVAACIFCCTPIILAFIADFENYYGTTPTASPLITVIADGSKASTDTVEHFRLSLAEILKNVHSSSTDTEADSNVSISDIIDYPHLSVSEIMDAAREETPTLEYICPFENSKCVLTMEHTSSGEHITTWDIYIFNYDGFVGTWIVNDFGKDITFYGDVLLYTFDSSTVHLGDVLTDGENNFYEAHLCVSPDYLSNGGTGFMVVTYPWEITE